MIGGFPGALSLYNQRITTPQTKGLQFYYNDFHMLNEIKGAVTGFVVGDALGVPVEFVARDRLDKRPVTTMNGHGSHNQPAGTWSDDTSLMLCTLESLANSYSLNDMSEKFKQWLYHGYMTPFNKPFGIGKTTLRAIGRLGKRIPPTQSGGILERDNGNGSLMRILPLGFYTADMELEKVYEIVNEVSAITHAHPITRISCFFYVVFVSFLLTDKNVFDAYETAKLATTYTYTQLLHAPEREYLPHFDRILENKIFDYPVNEIKSNTYVIDTLEAVLWAFINSRTYKDAVLNAVNLGHDTDTIGALVGGLAGLHYGYDSIPSEWIDTLQAKDTIQGLVATFSQSIMEKNTSRPRGLPFYSPQY